MPYDDDLAHASAKAAEGVETLAQCESGRQVEHRNGRQRQDHVTASHADVAGVSGDRNGSRQAHSRVEHTAELVGAHADEPGIITAGESYCGNPDQWQRKAEQKIG